jgi:hypothetical protein
VKAWTKLARERDVSKSEIVREALEALSSGKRRSVTALAGRLVGSLDGPKDLSDSLKRLAGYGR